jgi:lipase chaperone LimK
MARTHQALLSAAAYHFGSYRKAVQQAGVDYATVLRRPWWTRKKIIELIKKARRHGLDLHWSAISRRRDLLGRAALASLQARLFGKWSRALHAAGLDADEISRYQRWDRNTVIFELKSRAQEGEPMSSGTLQKKDAALHAAAVRYFANYDTALRAAKLEPGRFRQRRKWDAAAVLREIRAEKKGGARLSDSSVRREKPALYGAAARWFGSFSAARAKAGVRFVRGGKR